MKKRYWGIVALIALAFVITLGTKTVYAKNISGTLEYDLEYYGSDYDDDGIYDSVYLSYNYAEKIIQVTQPTWLYYEYEKGYSSETTYFRVYKTGDLESDINYLLLPLITETNKKGKVKLLPGTYKIESYASSYESYPLSYLGTTDTVVLKYQLKTGSFKSVTYSSTYPWIGEFYYLPMEIDGNPVEAKYTCNKKNRIKVLNDGLIKIVGTGKFTLSVKAGGYTMKIKFNIDRPEFYDKDTLLVGETYTYNLYSFFRVGQPDIKFSSSDKSVATITSDGELKAKKAGTTTITAIIENIKVKFNIKVNANEYHNEDMKTDFRDLEDGGFYVYPLTLKFNSDGSLSYSAYIVNKNKQTMNFDWIRVEIYNYNGDLIAKQKFENRKESVDYGDFIKINLKIDKNNIYSTDVDLYNGYFDEQWTVNWY